MATTSEAGVPPAAPLGLAESARRLGSYAWVELRLFEILGGWVAITPEPEVKLCLRAHSHHHAWHGELWHDRLPQLGEMPRDAAVAPANETVAAFVDALAWPDAPDQTIERLAGVFRVLVPHKIAAYGDHLERARAVTDGPTIRSLRLVLHDELDDWQAGERLLQSLVETPDDVDRAAEHQARLERLLVAAGGIAGAGTLAGRTSHHSGTRSNVRQREVR